MVILHVNIIERYIHSICDQFDWSTTGINTKRYTHLALIDKCIMKLQCKYKTSTSKKYGNNPIE